MSRSGLWLLAGLLATTLVGAQPASEADEQAYQARQKTEKARISAARQRLAQNFAAEQAACQHRFAVNDCIDQSRKAQRDALADLRRQEVLLADEDRRRKAGARLDKLQDKAAEHARDAASRPTAAPKEPRPPPRPASGKLPAAGDKAAPERDLAREAENEEALRRKLDAHAAEAAQRAGRAARAEEEERRYDEKQRKAAEYRARVLQRGADKPSTAQPLPAPGS